MTSGTAAPRSSSNKESIQRWSRERLGHSPISMTLDTYSHVVPGMQERAVLDLEKRLFSRANPE